MSMFAAVILVSGFAPEPPRVLHCDTAILGGGIAGLYAAYRLAQRNDNGKTCLFEADDIFGGRVKDVEIDGRSIGVGALRVSGLQVSELSC